jgi:hypothetical protein
VFPQTYELLFYGKIKKTGFVGCPSEILRDIQQSDFLEIKIALSLPKPLNKVLLAGTHNNDKAPDHFFSPL